MANSVANRNLGPTPINIETLGDQLDGGHEFLRVWRGADGSVICIVNPVALGPDPFIFGMTLVDCVNHAAKAWENVIDGSFADIRERIWEGLDAERANPTDENDYH